LINENLSLVLIKHDAMKMYGGVEVVSCIFDLSIRRKWV